VRQKIKWGWRRARACFSAGSHNHATHQVAKALLLAGLVLGLDAAVAAQDNSTRTEASYINWVALALFAVAIIGALGYLIKSRKK